MKKNKIIEKRKLKFGLIITLCFILIGFLIIFFNKNTDCNKIAKKVANLFEETTIVNEGKDNDNNYSYIDSAVIYTEKVGSVESGNYAIAISKYNSNEDAKAKTDFLTNIYKLFHQKIDGTLLENIEEITDNFEGENDLIFTDGVYLVRINSYYEKDFSELQNKIIPILKNFETENIESGSYDLASNYWNNKLSEISNFLEDSHNQVIVKFQDFLKNYIEDMNTCIGEECDDYLNEALKYKQYPEIAEQIQLVQNKYDEVMNNKKEIVNSIDKSIASVEKTLNKTDYDNIKSKIDELKDTYYDEYKKEWQIKLDLIDEKVFKKSCTSLKYKEVLRNPDDYKGKNVYWFGKVLQIASKSSYSTFNIITMRVGVDCKKYTYINDYSCENTIYVSYIGDKSIIEDDMIKIYGTMDGNQSYTSVLGATITIPKVSARYINIE